MSNLSTDGKSLLRAFPYALTRDNDKQKLAESIADDIARLVSNADLARILPRIDELPEEVLDILAADFKVEWYEVNAPISFKRKTIKECILVHKFKGTKYAVETALHSVFTDAKVEEWFEYGGEPFHFKLTVYGSSGGSDLKGLIARIQYAKNLRSVMDNTVFVIIPSKPADVFAGGKRAAQSKTIGAVAKFTGDAASVRAAPVYAAVKRVAAMSKTIGATAQFTGESVSIRAAPYHIAATSCVKIKTVHAAVYYDE